MRMEWGAWGAFQYLLDLASPDQFHYFVGNIINSERYFLKLLFKRWTIHVTVLLLQKEGVGHTCLSLN